MQTNGMSYLNRHVSHVDLTNKTEIELMREYRMEVQLQDNKYEYTFPEEVYYI